MTTVLHFLLIFITAIHSLTFTTYNFSVLPIRLQRQRIKNIINNPEFIENMHKVRGIQIYQKKSVQFFKVSDIVNLNAEYSYLSDVQFLSYRPFINEIWTYENNVLLCKSLNTYADSFVKFKIDRDSSNISINISIESSFIPNYFKRNIENRIINVFKTSMNNYHIQLTQIYLKE